MRFLQPFFSIIITFQVDFLPNILYIVIDELSFQKYISRDISRERYGDKVEKAVIYIADTYINMLSSFDCPCGDLYGCEGQ